jgi:hypothetical protein
MRSRGAVHSCCLRLDGMFGWNSTWRSAGTAVSGFRHAHAGVQSLSVLRMTAPPAHPTCALCQAHPAIKHSHIVTRHMARWAKSRSATGYFRQERAPSKPEKDLPKIPLLCVNCEGRFEKWERKFHAVWDRWCLRLEQCDPEVLIEDVRLSQSKWMRRLVISLCWRALHLGSHGERLTKLNRRSRAAHREWQNALVYNAPPRHSVFLIMQARRMDALLKQQMGIGNRSYIFSTTDISSPTTTLRGPIQAVMVHADGRRDVIDTRELKISFRVGVVKSYGFLFMGAHLATGMPPIPLAEFWKMVAGQFLKGSARRNKTLWAGVSPKQRAQQEEVERKNVASGNPALFMRLKMADRRERAASRESSARARRRPR